MYFELSEMTSQHTKIHGAKAEHKRKFTALNKYITKQETLQINDLLSQQNIKTEQIKPIKQKKGSNKFRTEIHEIKPERQSRK